MVGDPYLSPVRRPPEFYNAQTEPAAMDLSARPRVPASTIAARLGEAPSARAELRPQPSAAGALLPLAGGAGLLPPAAFGPETPLPEMPLPSAVEPSDVAHDPELDEAVIAFANADFEQCESALIELTQPSGVRAEHAETWLVLFDLYRATGQHAKFEALALEYAQRFGWSAPQWFSMPRLVAEAAVEERPRAPHIDGQVGWVSPAYIDVDAVAKLSSLTLQMPLPWVFDWKALDKIDAEACGRLSELFRSWIGQDIDMRWLGGERLLGVLAEAAPVGARDVDPAYWQVRLDALRMAHRPDQFDEAAIDYCVTYERSPPSWEPALCEVRISGSGAGTTAPPMSVVSDVSTSFLESHLSENSGTVHMGTVELSGQLVGDIGVMLKQLDAQLGAASVVTVSCAKLIRVDFIAAGDLLNWVLARRSENRSVTFADAHRMVALFFGAMGINEHAKVKVRTV